MSTHVKPSLNMQKKSCQIILRSRNNQIQNFQAKILQIFELVIWKIDDVINSFWLYLTFRIHLKWKNYSIFLHRSNSHCSCLLCNLMKVMDKFPIWSCLASVTDDHVRRLGKDWVFYCEKDNTGCLTLIIILELLQLFVCSSKFRLACHIKYYIQLEGNDSHLR